MSTVFCIPSARRFEGATPVRWRFHPVRKIDHHIEIAVEFELAGGNGSEHEKSTAVGRSVGLEFIHDTISRRPSKGRLPRFPF